MRIYLGHLGMSAIGTKRTFDSCRLMSAFGGKADIVPGKADIKKCPLMTQSGHAERHYECPRPHERKPAVSVAAQVSADRSLA